MPTKISELTEELTPDVTGVDHGVGVFGGVTKKFQFLNLPFYLKSVVDSLLSGKSNTGHTHDDRYFTEAESNARFSQLGHTHTTTDITDLASYTGFDARYGALASNAEFVAGTATDKSPNVAQTAFDIVSGDVLINSVDTEFLINTSTATKTRDIQLSLAGTYSVSFDMRADTGNNDVYAQVYVDGVATGTLHYSGDVNYATYTDEITITAGQSIQLYTYYTDGGGRARNFRIKAGFRPKIAGSTIVL